MSIHITGEGKKYINTKERTKIIEDDIFGKEFLIVEKLQQFDWKLLNETKKIGDYTCFKAKLLVPVSDKQKKEYEEFLKKEEIKPSLFKMQEPKDKMIIAWYTPEIPASFGPNNYWGLPGLILEVTDGKTVILCSKVVLNTKDKKEIKAPKNGKEVTQAEYDKIVMEKMAEMREMNQGQGGRGGTQFRIGG